MVALSGGVDSSISAALLKAKGWKVTGVHFLLTDVAASKACRGDAARRVADHLRIPIQIIDLQKEFEEAIIDPFTGAYLKGLTPNPCVLCNELIKFRHLFHFADQNNFSHVATGHYARIKDGGEGFAELWRGKDRGKEQSYFLHRLNPGALSRILLPLGDMTKKETRRMAADLGLPSMSEPESQEICFVPGNDYRLFLEEREGIGLIRRGEIVDEKGMKLGEHNGTYRFTIGQRHGLGIASSRPYYVKALRPERNEIMVARKEELYASQVEADSFHWLTGVPRRDPLRVSAQIRYRHDPAPAWLDILTPEKVRLQFDGKQWAVTPGQALVCYDGDRLLGGGWITFSGDGERG